MMQYDSLAVPEQVEKLEAPIAGRQPFLLQRFSDAAGWQGALSCDSVVPPQAPPLALMSMAARPATGATSQRALEIR